jgi:hypothetical protein
MLIRAFLPLVAVFVFATFVALVYLDSVRRREPRRFRWKWFAATIMLVSLAVPWAKYLPCELGTSWPDEDGCNICNCDLGGKSCTLVYCYSMPASSR